MNTIKNTMKNLFKLTENKVLPIECFILYWLYWIYKSQELTQIDVAEIIGKRSPKTIRQYNKILSDCHIVKFDVIRRRGISGFKAMPLMLSDEKVRKLSRVVKKSIEKVIKVDSKYIDLAKLLYSEHKKRDANYLDGKNIEKIFLQWADSIRLLVEKDNRDIETVQKIIKWCQREDSFWVQNILSGKKLRSKFAMLYSQYMYDLNKNKKYNKHKRIKNKKFKGVNVKELLNDL